MKYVLTLTTHLVIYMFLFYIYQVNACELDMGNCAY